MKDVLDTKLAAIKRVFNADDILNRPAEDPRAIARYYRVNRLAYDLFNSRKGFVHMGLSRGGVFTHDDFYEQGRVVAEHIDTRTTRVLELAPGKAATTEYLAKRFVDVQFHGIDLPNGQLDASKFKAAANLTLISGDYHDLSNYKSGSMDIVYVIEALCHAADRPKVLGEVNRVLRPGGKFIVFDGYATKPNSAYTDSELLAMNLLFKSMMVTDKNHYYGDFTRELRQQKLTLVHEEDLSQAIMPSLRRLESKAKKYVDHPKFANTIRRFLPDEFLGNAIAGYLFPATVSSGIFEYMLTVVQKSSKASRK